MDGTETNSVVQTATELVGQLVELPPFAKVTSKLLTSLEDDSVPFSELAKIISADPSLTMTIIRMSNSPFYMVGRSIETIRDAVLVLGIDMLKHIATAASIKLGLSKLKPRSDVFDMLGFWNHSYATAVSSARLTRRANCTGPDVYYLTGLIHDIGKLVQALYWPEAWRAAMNTLRASSEPLETIERRLFSLTHAEITLALCRGWQFPRQVVVLLEHQPHYELVNGRLVDPHMVLSLANAIADACGFRFPLEETAKVSKTDLKYFGDVTRSLPEEVEYELQILST